MQPLAFTGRGEQVVNSFLPAFWNLRNPAQIAPFLIDIFFISLLIFILGYVLFGTFHFVRDGGLRKSSNDLSKSNGAEKY